MVSIEIIPTTSDHIIELLLELKDLDKDELYRFGADKEEMLLKIYKRSIFVDSVIADGKLVWIFGVLGEYLGETGRPWSLFTPEGEKISPFIVTCFYRQAIDKMLQLFPVLIDMVDIKHTKVLRMLKIVGFKFGEPEPFMNGLFIKATRRV